MNKEQQTFTRQEVQDIINRLYNVEQSDDCYDETIKIAEEYDFTLIKYSEDKDEPSDEDLKSELNWDTEDEIDLDSEDDEFGLN